MVKVTEFVSADVRRRVCGGVERCVCVCVVGGGGVFCVVCGYIQLSDAIGHVDDWIRR